MSAQGKVSPLIIIPHQHKLLIHHFQSIIDIDRMTEPSTTTPTLVLAVTHVESTQATVTTASVLGALDDTSTMAGVHESREALKSCKTWPAPRSPPREAQTGQPGTTQNHSVAASGPDGYFSFPDFDEVHASYAAQAQEV
jgi:hypothetical protein